MSAKGAGQPAKNDVDSDDDELTVKHVDPPGDDSDDEKEPAGPNGNDGVRKVRGANRAARRAAAAGEAPTAGEASKTKRAADIKDDDSDPDFGLSAVFRPPNEPVVHERQPDDDGAFSAALPRRVPRRALAA